MTTPITKTIPTRDRWIDKTFQYPAALTQQTFRTNMMVIGCFIISLFSFTLVVPMCLLATFLVARLFLSYRHFKQSYNAAHHLPIKKVKRLIPMFSLGFMSLLFTALLFSVAALIFKPCASITAAVMLLSAAWGFLGLFIGGFLYPELNKESHEKTQGIFQKQSSLDFSNLNGLTNPMSPNYSGRNNQSMFRK